MKKEEKQIVELSDDLVKKAYSDNDFEGVVDFIKSQVDPDRVYDMEVKQDMADCRTNAHNVARSKTLIEKAGAALIKAEKAKIEKKVKSIKDSQTDVVADLVALQTAVRLPLTNWETARSDVDNKIKTIDALSQCLNDSSETIQTKLDTLKSYQDDEIVTDKLHEYLSAIDRVNGILTGQLDVAKIRESEQEELMRLRASSLASTAPAPAIPDIQDSAPAASVARDEEPADKSVEDIRAVNKAVVADLISKCKLSEEQAKAVVICVAQGRIGHLAINY
jgi:flagellin-specific chaperone FliS